MWGLTNKEKDKEKCFVRDLLVGLVSKAYLADLYLRHKGRREEGGNCIIDIMMDRLHLRSTQ